MSVARARCAGRGPPRTNRSNTRLDEKDATGKKIANDLARELPMRLDRFTVLDSATYIAATDTFHYTYSADTAGIAQMMESQDQTGTVRAHEILALRDQLPLVLKAYIVPRLCNAQLKRLFAAGYTLSATYRESVDGSHLFVASIPAECDAFRTRKKARSSKDVTM